MAIKTPCLYGLKGRQRIGDVTLLCHTLMSHVWKVYSSRNRQSTKNGFV